MNLGKRIRDLRISKDYTQEDVAKALDITRQAVARWESSASMPSTANLLALADFFQVPISSFFEEPYKQRSRQIARVGLKWIAAYLVLYLAGYVAFYLIGAPPQIWFLREWLFPICAAVSLTGALIGREHIAASLLVSLSIGIVLGTLWNTFGTVGPAGLRKGFVITFICIIIGLIIGCFLERHIVKEPLMSGRIAKWLHVAFYTALVVLMFSLTLYSIRRLGFIRGADAAVVDGFSVGALDAENGREFAPGSQQREPSSDIPFGGPAYSGWIVYWGVGYEAGYMSNQE